MAAIKLGVIGLSEGNGHPYSWSAIFNGYDPAAMAESGYPVISQYLGEQSFPQAAIAEAEVTHVWAQTPALSETIARAANIPHCVERAEQMIGCVDGLLLARDDAENHVTMALPFIEAGIPVYIDKPIVLSLAELEQLFTLRRYAAQIFSCSALRYAQELCLDADERAAIGPIKSVLAEVPKSWDKYAVHVIEPVLALVGFEREVIRSLRWRSRECCTLHLLLSGDIELEISSRGSLPAPISITVYGEKGFCRKQFKDSFAAFKAALQQFVKGIANREVIIPDLELRKVVEILERGRHD